ncbi:MAG: 4Fe-4S dicluster domain-containing protein [Coriobacteriia bacterium]|nr:4Fe-4S dicluster domain-containing protein [Coriobacteriia bacterium]
MVDNDTKDVVGQGISRRQFMTGVGGAGVGMVLGGLVVKGFILPDEVLAIPASEGYLLVDTKKCSGCTTCMMACSLVHEGRSDYSLSRIQITQNPMGRFPDDIFMAQCRQCPYPPCVEACPTGANHADAENGNVRTVDPAKCIGCERCIQACPYTPSRMQWNAIDKNAQKCDLCANTPYWDEEGGPGGKQACVEMCPMHAITFTTQTPVQSTDGYEVDLRTGTSWELLGLSA